MNFLHLKNMEYKNYGNRVTSHRDYCGNFIYEDGVLKIMIFLQYL